MAGAFALWTRAADAQPAQADAQPAQGSAQDATLADADPIVARPVEVRERGRGQRALTDESPESPDAARGLEDPAFVSVVHVEDRAGEATSVAEELAQTVGVHVRSLGGLGSFSSISVRGAAPGHTAVLVDGVPLSRIASTTVDLGQFSLPSLSELELYRGGVPVELGGSALGGALNLRTQLGVPASGKRLAVAAGAGSFGARHAAIRWLGGSEDRGRRGTHLSLAYAGATGDFTYFHDNGTNLNPSDDSFVARTNNGYDQASAVARAAGLVRGTLIEGGGRWLWKQQGIPGSASAQSQTASLTSLGQLVDVQATQQRLLGSPRLVGTASAFLDLGWQHYQDLAGEIGTGTQDRRYASVSGGMTGRMTIDVGPQHVLAAGAEAQADYFRELDALAAPGEDSLRSHGTRTGAALTLADDWIIDGDERVIVRPGVRLDWLRTVPLADKNAPVADELDLAPRTDVFLGPRLAGRVRVWPGMVAKASAGRYFRAPTVVELFGDRGFLVGNPGLRAETGMAADLGLVLAPARAVGAVDRIHVEAAGFALRPRDTIALVTTAGLASVPRNLGHAAIHGLEASAAARLARLVTLRASYTFLASRQDSPLPSYDGKPLPNRPPHQLHGRVDVARVVRGHALALWSDFSLVAGNVLDAAGLSRVPARQLVGAGVKVELGAGLLLGIEGKNLTNQRVESIALDPPPRPDLTEAPRAVADFFGYPLPGRSVYLTAEWQR